MEKEEFIKLEEMNNTGLTVYEFFGLTDAGIEFELNQSLFPSEFVFSDN